MEIIDNKFKITTTMDGQLPADPWNVNGTLVFRETMMLELTEIKNSPTKFNASYIWADLN